ncbi:MAG: hypothetical protein WBM65_14765 [Sedimenticolaceae bacterium]
MAEVPPPNGAIEPFPSGSKSLPLQRSQRVRINYEARQEKEKIELMVLNIRKNRTVNHRDGVLGGRLGRYAAQRFVALWNVGSPGGWPAYVSKRKECGRSETGRCKRRR